MGPVHPSFGYSYREEVAEQFCVYFIRQTEVCPRRSRNRRRAERGIPGAIRPRPVRSHPFLRGLGGP